MEPVKIFKALANETRLNILHWLKDPDTHFPPQSHALVTNDFSRGVCVGSIRDKTGLSQSTISEFLSLLQQAGLLEAKRIGQWTYFRRNEKAIEELIKWMAKTL
ncbi:regulatory protein ArsR [Desulfotomaculum nigrificans CO-1-SRB]|uniref:Regulatory protein ArsR n=1 Tax=Desulfotomaculum nigrificans (strain DSM 14880 / VKM B-2319 / CO-1-SRB) TaxID=868595 RepID=F6B6A3_DESCC|nr:metalloregulator ArsR/SmtB family transcription factor [Desulfotomaculum nigrificans]AEF95526.1 regulatory protein ArsR [Desulfotomaculum nigrificans CO-1-SRB]